MTDVLQETDRHLSFNTYCTICQQERAVFRRVEGYTVTTWCVNCGVIAVRQITGWVPPLPPPGTVASSGPDQKLEAPPVPEKVKKIPGYGEPVPLPHPNSADLAEEDL